MEFVKLAEDILEDFSRKIELERNGQFSQNTKIFIFHHKNL